MSMGGAHVFVDESKRAGYVVVAVSVDPDRVDGVRRALRAMLLPGQNSLHFRDERDGRRRALLAQMSALEVSATVYVSGDRHAVQARRSCLQALAADAAGQEVEMIWLELADGDLPADRRTLFQAQQELKAGFVYRHVRAPQEPGLWVADGVAWAWPQGGRWRQCVAAMIGDVVQV